MPKVYEVTVTKTTTITVVAPSGMPMAKVRSAVGSAVYDLMSDADEDVEVYEDKTISVQEAADRDSDDWRVSDDGYKIVEGEEVDWIEGVIARRDAGERDEEPVLVSKNQIPMFAVVAS